MIAKIYILTVIAVFFLWSFNKEIKFLIRLGFLIAGYDIVEKKRKRKAPIVEMKPKKKFNNG